MKQGSSSFALQTSCSSTCYTHGHHRSVLLQWYGNDSEESPRLTLHVRASAWAPEPVLPSTGPSRPQLSQEEGLSAPSSASHPTTGHQPAAAPPAASGNGLRFPLWSYPPGQLHTLQKSNTHSPPCRLPWLFWARKGKKSTWLTVCGIIYQKHL